MGGNALKNCVTRRYGADEYYQLDHNVFMKLACLFGETQVFLHTIDAYRAKESFGDLDILLGCDDLPSDWVERIVEEFKPKEWVKNSNVLSFEYKEFQIDVIPAPMKEFHTSKNYFAYNDLGNLLGRLAHSMGLKLGHDGLSYNWRIDTYQFKNEVISTDWEEICGVLGVSYDLYAQGFDTLEDIFKFVVASSFFHSDIYLLENRNNYARTRDKKRKTYTDFLVWIEGHEHTEVQLRNKVVRDTHSKDCWLAYQFSKISGFAETYERVQAEWVEAVEYKKRYNGTLVGEVCGITGKELGEFMKWMKETHDQERMRKDLLKFNPEVIPRWVLYWYNTYLGNTGGNNEHS